MHGLGHGLVDACPSPSAPPEVLADVLDVAGAQQHLLHLLAEVEAAGLVVGERHRPRQLRERLGEEDVAPAREDRQRDASEPAHARGGGSGGIDDEGRGDRRRRWSDAAHLAAAPRRSPSPPRLPRCARPARARASRKPCGHLGGPGQASRCGPHTAAIRSSTRRAGTIACASFGVMTRTSTPQRRCSAMRVSKPREVLRRPRSEEEVADLLDSRDRRRTPRLEDVEDT